MEGVRRELLEMQTLFARQRTVFDEALERARRSTEFCRRCREILESGADADRMEFERDRLLRE